MVMVPSSAEEDCSWIPQHDIEADPPVIELHSLVKI